MQRSKLIHHTVAPKSDYIRRAVRLGAEAIIQLPLAGTGRKRRGSGRFHAAGTPCPEFSNAISGLTYI